MFSKYIKPHHSDGPSGSEMPAAPESTGTDTDVKHDATAGDPEAKQEGSGSSGDAPANTQ